MLFHFMAIIFWGIVFELCAALFNSDEEKDKKPKNNP